MQAKTTLNNALIAELRRLNTRLDYSMESIGGVYRCTLELPHPERVVVSGEGGNKKDAERRCAAAACVKLMVSGQFSELVHFFIFIPFEIVIFACFLSCLILFAASII